MKLRSTSLALAALLFTLFANQLSASNYYWVGGTGNWSDFAHHWATTSGGNAFHIQVPQSVDNVYFDSHSFTAANQTVTIDQTIENVLNMDWTGATHQPTLDGVYPTQLFVFASLTLIRNMYMDFSGQLEFKSTATGNTITSNGATYNCSVYFDGNGGGWTLMDSFYLVGGIDMVYGNLNTNGKEVHCAGFEFDVFGFSTVSFGASVIDVESPPQYANYPVQWYCDEYHNHQINAGTSTINMYGEGDFDGGGQTYYNLNFKRDFLGTSNSAINLNGVGDSITTFHDVTFDDLGIIYGNNRFNNVTMSGDGGIEKLFSQTVLNTFNTLTLTPGHTYSFATGQTQTIKTLTANGSCSGIITLQSDTGGRQATLNFTGANTVSYTTLHDLAATGTTPTAANSVDLGDNTGWNILNLTTQNLYWVGNGGSWKDGNHWSLSSGGPPSGCQPTPGDNVFFDANSFSLNNQTVLVDTFVRFCRNMTCTGVTHNPTITSGYGTTLKIFGSLTFARAMSVNLLGPVTFDAITTGNTITMAGQLFSDSVSFNGSGGWLLQDSFTVIYSISFNNGSLNTNNQTVTANNFFSRSIYVRNLTMGSSVFNLGSNGSPFWSATADKLTLNAGTSHIYGTGFRSAVFSGGGLTYYDLSFTNPSISTTGLIASGNAFHDVFFASAGQIAGTNTFHSATLAGNANIGGTGQDDNTFGQLTLAPGHIYNFFHGSTQTIQTLVANGNCNALIYLLSDKGGYPATVSTSQTNVAEYLILRDMHSTGGFTANNSVDVAGNTGWAINWLPMQNLYWIGGTGSWQDGNHWSLTSGGPAYGCGPTPMDNVFFDANSFTASGQTVTIDTPVRYCHDMTWTGVTHQPALTGTGAAQLKVFGSLTFARNMSFPFAGNVFFEAALPHNTVTSQGQVFQNSVIFNGYGGGWALQDSFNTAQTILHYYGVLNTNGRQVSCNLFASTGDNQRQLALGSSLFYIKGTGIYTWTVTGRNFSLNCGTSKLLFTNTGYINFWSNDSLKYYDIIFYGPATTLCSDTFHDVSFNTSSTPNFDSQLYGYCTYNSLYLNGGGIVRFSNTCNNLTLGPGYTYTFSSYTTQTVNNQLNVSGTGGFPVRVEVDFAGAPFTFFKPHGSVCANFLRLSDCDGEGGAIYNAESNCQDFGGNINWHFLTSGTSASVNVTDNATGTICAGLPVTFTATATQAPSATYDWLVNDSVAQSGASNTFHTNAVAGNETVICIINGVGVCGANGIIATDTVVLTGNPPRPLISSATPTVCSGDTAEVCVQTGYATYHWNNGSTGSCTPAVNAGNYYVTVTDNNGCSAESAHFPISNFPVSSISITVAGDTLTTFGALSYQWFMDSNAIPGDTSARLVASTPGAYSVTETDVNGCTVSSNIIKVGALGISETNAAKVEIYPNPISGSGFRLNTPDDVTGSQLDILNANGQVVYRSQIKSNSSGISFEGNAGLYFVHIYSNGSSIVRKVVKL